MPASGKQRLDVRLHELGLSESREQGRRLIMAGEVTVDGETVDRPSAAVSAAAAIALKRKPRFVSRGGEKLDAALTAFGLDVTGWGDRPDPTIALCVRVRVRVRVRRRCIHNA